MIYQKEVKVNDNISIHIPTLKEIIDYSEENYFKLTSLFTATSKDYMVMLDDMKIDFENISDFDLFSQLLIRAIKETDTTIYFGDFSFDNFTLIFNNESKENILYDEEKNIVIDRLTHFKIASILREMNHIEYDRTKPGNKEAKQFMIERARKKQKRKSKSKSNHLLNLIIPLVNSPEFNYNFETILDINIYALYESIKSIQKRLHYNQVMAGIYAGAISTKDVNLKEINWLN